MQVKTVQYGLGERGPREPRDRRARVRRRDAVRTRQLAANRCDFGDDILAHPLDDDYHRARSPVWDKITAPLLTAANWGGQGLHPRGNFEGFVRAASKDKWLEAHGIEHWTHFYTDYGVALQKRFFDHFLKGENERLGQAAARAAPGAPRRPVRRAPRERMADRAHALDEAPSRRRRAASSREAPKAAEAVSLRRARRRAHLRLAAARSARPRSPGRSRRGSSSRRRRRDADLFLVFRVFTPDLREVVFMGAIDPHTPIAQGWLRASHRKLDPKLSTPYRPYHTHDERQPLAPRRDRRARRRAVADEHRRAGRLPHRADACAAATTNSRSRPARGSRTSRTSCSGCGPFLHDDPRDRPEGDLRRPRPRCTSGPQHLGLRAAADHPAAVRRRPC